MAQILRYQHQPCICRDVPSPVSMGGILQACECSPIRQRYSREPEQLDVTELLTTVCEAVQELPFVRRAEQMMRADEQRADARRRAQHVARRQELPQVVTGKDIAPQATSRDDQDVVSEDDPYDDQQRYAANEAMKRTLAKRRLPGRERHRVSYAAELAGVQAELTAGRLHGLNH